MSRAKGFLPTAGGDSRLQNGEAALREVREDFYPSCLQRIYGHPLRHLLEMIRQRVGDRVVPVEEALIPGQKEAALGSLGIPQIQRDLHHQAQHLLRSLHGALRMAEPDNATEGEDPDDDEEEQRCAENQVYFDELSERPCREGER